MDKPLVIPLERAKKEDRQPIDGAQLEIEAYIAEQKSEEESREFVLSLLPKGDVLPEVDLFDYLEDQNPE